MTAIRIVDLATRVPGGMRTHALWHAAAWAVTAAQHTTAFGRYVITHIPTGRSCCYYWAEEDAIRALDVLAREWPEWGHGVALNGVPEGDAPRQALIDAGLWQVRA